MAALSRRRPVSLRVSLYDASTSQGAARRDGLGFRIRGDPSLTRSSGAGAVVVAFGADAAVRRVALTTGDRASEAQPRAGCALSLLDRVRIRLVSESRSVCLGDKSCRQSQMARTGDGGTSS